MHLVFFWLLFFSTYTTFSIADTLSFIVYDPCLLHLLDFESCLYLSVLFCFCDMLMTLILTSLIHCVSGLLSNTMIIDSLLRFDRRFFNFIHFCFLRIKIYTFFAHLDVYILLQSVFPYIINRNNYDLRD